MKPIHRLAAIMLAAGVLPAVSGAAAAAAATPRCHGHLATIVGTRGNDHIVGTRGRDVIVAGPGPGLDRVHGGRGADVICGGSGSDRLYGDRGADRLYGNRAGDDVFGGRGKDLLAGGAASFDNENNLWGGRGDDRYLATAHSYDDLSWADPSRADGQGSPIHVDLRAGTATGEGHDTILSATSGGGPTLFLPRGSTASGNASSETFVGDNVTVHGRAGNDAFFTSGTVFAGPGDDRIETGRVPRAPFIPVVHGGPGDDQVEYDGNPDPAGLIDGGSGTDQVTVALGPHPTPYAMLSLDLDRGLLTADSVSLPVTGFESASFDLLYGQALGVGLVGTDGPNVLEAYGSGPIPVTVAALGGDDTINTGSGDDSVDGGAGSDAADTGDGADTCTSVEAPVNCETSTP